MIFHPGDIVIVPFPLSNQKGTKVRPAIVISNSTVNKTADIVLAQMTSNPRHDAFSFEIKNSMLTKHLPGYSEVRGHKIFIIEKSLVKSKISILKPEHIGALRTKIQSLML